MKSFLEGRQSVSTGASAQGKITKGAEFQPLNSGSISAAGGQSGNDDLQELVNPENDPNAPKVEYVKDGESIRRIVVSFGEHRVEIDCQY